MSPVHAAEAILVGAFATIVAAVEHANNLGWQVMIFLVGIALGFACVIVADRQLRRYTAERDRCQSEEAGRDA